MAGDIQVAHHTTGRTLYALVRNPAGQVWDGAGFVAYVTADRADYAIALTEQGTASRHYVGDFPAVSAGVYFVTAYDRAGGAPAEADVAVAAGAMQWGGAAEVPLSSRLAAADYEAPPADYARADVAPDWYDAPVDVTAIVTAIKERTDNLPDDPADAFAIAGLFASLQTHGDAAWATATGFSTHSADDVWAVGTRTLTAFGFTVAATVADKAGYSLSGSGLDLVTVDGRALPAALQLIGAVAAGGLPTGAGSGTEIFLGLDGVTPRVTFTVDEDGNRTAVYA